MRTWTSKTKHYTAAMEQTFTAARKVLRDLGYRVNSLDKPNGVINFLSGRTWGAWRGRALSMMMIDNGDGSMEVSVSGYGNSYGDREDIANAIFAKMDGFLT